MHNLNPQVSNIETFKPLKSTTHTVAIYLHRNPVHSPTYSWWQTPAA